MGKVEYVRLGKSLELYLVVLFAITSEIQTAGEECKMGHVRSYFNYHNVFRHIYKIAKATISFVHLSTCNNSASTRQILMKLDI
jgi:hypothetical protein